MIDYCLGNKHGLAHNLTHIKRALDCIAEPLLRENITLLNDTISNKVDGNKRYQPKYRISKLLNLILHE